MSEDYRFEAYGMKVRVFMKTPGALELACQESADSKIAGKCYDDDEHKHHTDILARAMREAITKRWMRYGEYVTVEFDLTAKTARVVEIGE